MVAADLWLPTQINPNGNERKNHTYGIVARLKPGVTMEQARAEMAMIGQRLEQQYPATNSGWGVRVFPMAEMYSGKIRPVLLGAVALLLLIACANLANLLLARAAARQKEIGVMGAGRMRIVRQLMTESLVLAFAGGLVGLMLAAASVRLLRGVIPDMFPTMKQMTFDGRVLLFTFGICILTCLLFGLVPESFACGAEHHRPKRQTGGRTAWEDRNEFAGRCWHRRWRWRCCFQ
jgi:predicted lysophospholipase L1 biosynthesis ABC-type transport system permease subunit